MMSARPDWENIQTARLLLNQHFRPTRLIPAPSLSRGATAEVFLKLESEMPTGSFKVRGALYALYKESAKRHLTEVVAASTGNHGAAVAYAARLTGIKAKIFLPHNANLIKQSRIRDLGAEIITAGKDISEAFADADDYARKARAFVLNDATDPNVAAGTGTIALEILNNWEVLQRSGFPSAIAHSFEGSPLPPSISNPRFGSWAFRQNVLHPISYPGNKAQACD
jgi:threonine dehydratase